MRSGFLCLGGAVLGMLAITVLGQTPATRPAVPAGTSMPLRELKLDLEPLAKPTTRTYRMVESKAPRQLDWGRLTSTTYTLSTRIEKDVVILEDRLARTTKQGIVTAEVNLRFPQRNLLKLGDGTVSYKTGEQVMRGTIDGAKWVMRIEGGTGQEQPFPAVELFDAAFHRLATVLPREPAAYHFTGWAPTLPVSRRSDLDFTVERVLVCAGPQEIEQGGRKIACTYYHFRARDINPELEFNSYAWVDGQGVPVRLMISIGGNPTGFVLAPAEETKP